MFPLNQILILVTITFALANAAQNLTKKSEPSLDAKKVNVKRGAVRLSKNKWLTSKEGGKTIVNIPYIVGEGLDKQAKSEIERAIKDLHEATCVRFRPWSGKGDYVSLETGVACSSDIGKRVGKNIVYLGAGCEYKGTILHEFIHMLGFFHEHNRADRDTYLRIYEENIIDVFKESVMKKYSDNMMDNLGFAYDLHSIVQYGKHAFAKAPGLVTMEAKSNPNMELGNRNAMSASDVMKINKLYHCAERKDVYKNMHVMVQTGDGWLDGTNSFLYLELIGDGGKRSGESSVDKGGHYDDFESGKTDHYLVAFKDVGPIRQLKVRLQKNPSGSYFDGWSFDKITIRENRDDAKTYTFRGQDLSPNESVIVDVVST